MNFSFSLEQVMPQLTEQQLLKLLGRVSPQTKQRVDEKLDECLATLKHYFGPHLRKPDVVYDLRGAVAGYAIGGHTMRLNTDLLNDERYVDEMIAKTVPHELCHNIAAQINANDRPHGKSWQRLMYVLGLEPDRCHQYEVAAARKHKKVMYYCKCGDHPIGIRMHAKILRGAKYKCRKCRRLLRRKEQDA